MNPQKPPKEPTGLMVVSRYVLQVIWLRPQSCQHRGCRSLQWRHNGRRGVSKHQPHDCLFKRRSKKTSKLRVTGLCVGNSPLTGEFPSQRATNAENVSIWWRHHGGLAHVWHKTCTIMIMRYIVGYQDLVFFLEKSLFTWLGGCTTRTSPSPFGKGEHSIRK